MSAASQRSSFPQVLPRSSSHCFAHCPSRLSRFRQRQIRHQTAVAQLHSTVAPPGANCSRHHSFRSAIENKELAFLEISELNERFFVQLQFLKNPLAWPPKNRMPSSELPPHLTETLRPGILSQQRDITRGVPLHGPLPRQRQHVPPNRNHYRCNGSYDNALAHAAEITTCPLGIRALSLSCPSVRLQTVPLTAAVIIRVQRNTEHCTGALNGVRHACP